METKHEFIDRGDGVSNCKLCHKDEPHRIHGWSEFDEAWKAHGITEQKFNSIPMSYAAFTGFLEMFWNLAKSAPSGEREMRSKANQAYVDYIAQMRKPECLGWEQKIREGEFGKTELDAHMEGSRLLGMHQAYSERGNGER